jgi:hypothetical protein
MGDALSVCVSDGAEQQQETEKKQPIEKVSLEYEISIKLCVKF